MRDPMPSPVLEDIEEEIGAASAGEQAYERIRTDIIFGRLRPGERLVLDKLKPLYGVSVSTLREILSRLVPEGFVTAEGQRGFQVSSCSAAELREIAELRLLLESNALKSSFAAGDVEWEGRFVAAHHKLAHIEERLLAEAEVSPLVWKRYDFEFHNALVSACGSRALLDLLAGVYDRYLRYQMVFGVFRGRQAADEHRALLDCALKRDASRAIDLLQGHIQGCVDFILARSPMADKRQR